MDAHPAGTFANLWSLALVAAVPAFTGWHFVTVWPLILAIGGIAAVASLLLVMLRTCCRVRPAGKVDVRPPARLI